MGQDTGAVQAGRTSTPTHTPRGQKREEKEEKQGKTQYDGPTSTSIGGGLTYTPREQSKDLEIVFAAEPPINTHNGAHYCSSLPHLRPASKIKGNTKLVAYIPSRIMRLPGTKVRSNPSATCIAVSVKGPETKASTRQRSTTRQRGSGRSKAQSGAQA